MEDAGNAIEGAAASSTSAPEANPRKTSEGGGRDENPDRENKFDRRKRKRDFTESTSHHGSRGGRGRGRGGEDGDSKRHKKGDMGRNAYL